MKTKFNTRVLTGTAMLAAVATVLMYMEFPIPIMPAFIKLDISDLPALLGTFSLGPVYGVAIQLVKNLLHLPFGSSAGVGELSNFILGAVFVFVAGIIYKHNKSRKSALVGSVAGAASMALVSIVTNYFIVYPAYVVLYGLPLEQVDAVIHRQSIIHSLVEFRDGAMIAQLGTPDMKLPIRYAFTWPRRAPSPDRPLDLLTCGDLTFRAPDMDAFPCLRIARQCARTGGTACAIMNGANEAAVALFLQERVGFNDIPRLVESALSRVQVKYAPDLPDILEADRQARAAVLQTVGDMV